MILSNDAFLALPSYPHLSSGREYHDMTLRGLYDYVIKAITNKMHRPEGPLTNTPPQSTGRQRSQSLSCLGETTSTMMGNTDMGGGTSIPVMQRSGSRSILTVENEQDILLTSPQNRPAHTPLKDRSPQHGNDLPAITYRERLGGYLHPRDMRRLVTPFSSTNEPELMVRRHVMLLNFDPLRAIVLRDRLLVLVPTGADSILIRLEEALRGGIEDARREVFGDATSTLSPPPSNTSDSSKTSHGEAMALDTILENIDILKESSHSKKVRQKSKSPVGGIEDEDLSLDDDTNGTKNDDLDIDNEWDDIEGMDWIKMSFELQSVDAVLSSVCEMLSSDARNLRDRILFVMEELRGASAKTTSPGDHIQEKLRLLKDEVKEMEARIQGLVRAINLILDDEEDMALMNLSRIITNPERFIQPVPQEVLNEESDEPELLLEAHLQHALSEVNALELLKGNISNTEELVSLKMDTIRNRLLYINTVVSVISLCVATASLVGSIFGMNLVNHLEKDNNAFMEVVIGTIVGIIFLMIAILSIIARSGTMTQREQSQYAQPLR